MRGIHISRNYAFCCLFDIYSSMHRVYPTDTILSRNSDTGIASLSCMVSLTVEVGMYRAGYRALYSEGLIEHKHSFVFNSILFYFDIPMPMFTTLSDAYNACIALPRAWLICELLPDMIGCYGVDVVPVFSISCMRYTTDNHHRL